jgi:hypothetical protein
MVVAGQKFTVTCTHCEPFSTLGSEVISDADDEVEQGLFGVLYRLVC